VDHRRPTKAEAERGAPTPWLLSLRAGGSEELGAEGSVEDPRQSLQRTAVLIGCLIDQVGRSYRPAPFGEPRLGVHARVVVPEVGDSGLPIVIADRIAHLGELLQLPRRGAELGRYPAARGRQLVQFLEERVLGRSGQIGQQPLERPRRRPGRVKARALERGRPVVPKIDGDGDAPSRAEPTVPSTNFSATNRPSGVRKSPDRTGA
jgi:hypothetical protein